MAVLTRSAVLHIGTEKTGSTALQNALVRGRPELRVQGFQHPAIDFHALVLALSKGRSDALVESTLATLKAEVEASPPETVFLLSSEFCHSRLTTVEAAANLLNLLSAAGLGPWRIVVYFRDQCSLFESSHAEGVKAGMRWTYQDQLSEYSGYYSHRRIAERWRDAGRRLDPPATLSIHSYNRRAKGVVRHFLGEAGLPRPENLDVDRSDNVRSSRAVTETVRHALGLADGLTVEESTAFYTWLAPLDPRPVLPSMPPEMREAIKVTFGPENLAMCAEFGLDPQEFSACAPSDPPDLKPLDADDLVRMLLKSFRSRQEPRRP